MENNKERLVFDLRLGLDSVCRDYGKIVAFLEEELNAPVPEDAVGPGGASLKNGQTVGEQYIFLTRRLGMTADDSIANTLFACNRLIKGKDSGLSTKIENWISDLDTELARMGYYKEREPLVGVNLILGSAIFMGGVKPKKMTDFIVKFGKTVFSAVEEGLSSEEILEVMKEKPFTTIFTGV